MTAGSSTSRSRWTKTWRAVERVGEQRRAGSIGRTPRVSSSTRSGPSRSRTPTCTTRVGSSAGRRSKPASHSPQAPARHMPPRKPRRRRLGRVEVAVGVEPQDRARRGGGAATAGSVVSADRAVARRAAPGSSPAASASSTWPPASSRQPRESRRSSVPVAGRAARRASRSAAASRRAARPARAPAPRRPRAASDVRSEVRQQQRRRRAARSPALPLRARASRRTP